MSVPFRLRLIISQKLEKPVYALATGDFDGDGKIEIATGSEDLRIFKYDKGKLEPIWNTKFWAWIDHIIAADINQDYSDEIIVISGRKLLIYKYTDPVYENIWEYESDTPISSVFVGDSNNNRQNELLIGCNDGTVIIFTQKDQPFSFKQAWRKKYEGDTLVALADLDADTLNETIVVNNDTFRVFRIPEKFPKKEVWAETFHPYAKKLFLFDLNADKKSEIFLGMEDGTIRVYSHKDGNYFSKDRQYRFDQAISAFSAGQLHDKNTIIAGSYDKSIRGFHESEIFKIETYDKIHSLAFSDIDHDGIDEILCASGSNLYIFKDEVFLACQIEYPVSIFADEELTVNYLIRNNSENRITNLDFSNFGWVPKIIELKKSTSKVPVLEPYSGVELQFRFSLPKVDIVTPIVFPRFKATFEMDKLQLSQSISEVSVHLLPPFKDVAENILQKCEHFKNIKIPLKSLAKLVGKEIGPIDHTIERIINRLIDERMIEGSISNWVLSIQNVNPYSERVRKPVIPTDQKVIPPHLFISTLKQTVRSKRRTLLPELINQFNRSGQELEETLIRLKENFEITGVLIPTEEFLFLTAEEINSIIETLDTTPNITLEDLGAKYDFLEKEIEFLINDLVNLGAIHGQIITTEGTTRFISVNLIANLLLEQLEKEGKVTILTYSRKKGISGDQIREAIRMLIDNKKVQGTYTFNGAIFYTENKLMKEILNIIKISDVNSIGLSSLAKDFMISKDIINSILNKLINTDQINGYISENTLFLKSYEEERLRDIYEKYSDALNLIHLLVIHKESGIAIFSGSYTTDVIDPVLVSGFLQAITSFGSEISGSKGPFRLLHYKDFKISVQEGENILAALILKADPSQRLLEILKHFIRFFEANYRDYLEAFKGGVDPFKTADALVDDFFEISLSFPHEIQEKEVFRNKDRLSVNELSMINMARSLGRKFMLSMLIENSSNELLISQLEAFSIIYNLRDKKILYVPTEERKWCPYCGSIIQKSATSCPHCLKDIYDTT
jgi:hypothetical protein